MIELETKGHKFNILNTIDLGKVSVSITSDNLFVIEIEKDTEVNLFITKEIIKATKTLGRGLKIPAIIIANDFSLPTKETREFLANAEASPQVSAEAYILKSTAQSIIGNFYLNVNKPERPTRMFTKINEALKWLDQFKVEG
jgi:hypothetical protein